LGFEQDGENPLYIHETESFFNELNLRYKFKE